MPEGDGLSSAASAQTSFGSASHLPWHLIPTFEPGETDLTEYTKRLEFLAGIWPVKHLGQLAPRAALQCKGSAFQKVVRLQPDKLKVNDLTGVKLLVSTLGGVWGKTTLEDKYEKFERAIFGTSQRSDESNESYLARHEILFEDMISQGATLTDMRAYILLRNSVLSADDKKRVLVEAKGNLKYDSVTEAIRMLGAKFFQEIQGQQKSHRNKTYEVNYMQDGDEETFVGETEHVFAADGSDLPDTVIEQFLTEGDEDALVVAQFEDALIDTVQNDSEMNVFLSSYVEARRKLTEKSRSRGFWPLRSSQGHKGSGKKGKQKGFQFRARKPLALRIAESDCRLCGQRGHWRAECPKRSQMASAASGPPKSSVANVLISANGDAEDDTEDVFLMEPAGEQANEAGPQVQEAVNRNDDPLTSGKIEPPCDPISSTTVKSMSQTPFAYSNFSSVKLGVPDPCQSASDHPHGDSGSCRSIQCRAENSEQDRAEQQADEHELRGDRQAHNPLRREQVGASLQEGSGRGSEILPVVSPKSPSIMPTTCIDLETEEDTWDQISTQDVMVEQRNSRRLDMIEDALAQVMDQLQILTQAAQGQLANTA
eukprot:s6071_g1.t1